MRRSSFIPFILAILLASSPSAAQLEVTPGRIVLSGRYSEARLLVRAGNRDATGTAKLQVADGRIAKVAEDGFVRPRADGKTTVTVRAGGRSTTVPIEVRAIT